ncbi:hypothetical protein [Nostoc sp.]
MIIKSSQAIVLSQLRAIAQTHFFGKLRTLLYERLHQRESQRRTQ